MTEVLRGVWFSRACNILFSLPHRVLTTRVPISSRVSRQIARAKQTYNGFSWAIDSEEDKDRQLISLSCVPFTWQTGLRSFTLAALRALRMLIFAIHNVSEPNPHYHILYGI